MATMITYACSLKGYHSHCCKRMRYTFSTLGPPTTLQVQFYESNVVNSDVQYIRILGSVGHYQHDNQ